MIQVILELVQRKWKLKVSLSHKVRDKMKNGDNNFSRRSASYARLSFFRLNAAK